MITQKFWISIRNSFILSLSFIALKTEALKTLILFLELRRMAVFSLKKIVQANLFNNDLPAQSKIILLAKLHDVTLVLIDIQCLFIMFI